MRRAGQAGQGDREGPGVSLGLRAFPALALARSYERANANANERHTMDSRYMSLARHYRALGMHTLADWYQARA